MFKKMLIVTLVLLLLSGCKKSTELIEPYEMTNHNIETLNSAEEQGVYEIYSLKKQLIVYRGIDNGVKTMTYSINNNQLTIFFETEELSQPKDFAYKISSTSSFDSIQIQIDGKGEAFHTIFAE
ncbi:MAG: hypothetical protein K0S47_2657 [Herbinix sp.]|jgi:hypothetical protein|nr:hypothetical protein [Herbinix sp.]